MVWASNRVGIFGNFAKIWRMIFMFGGLFPYQMFYFYFLLGAFSNDFFEVQLKVEHSGT